MKKYLQDLQDNNSDAGLQETLLDSIAVSKETISLLTDKPGQSSKLPLEDEALIERHTIKYDSPFKNPGFN